MSGKTSKRLRQLVRATSSSEFADHSRVEALKRGYARTPATEKGVLLTQLGRAAAYMQSMKPVAIPSLSQVSDVQPPTLSSPSTLNTPS